MTRPIRLQYPNAFYHIMNRGNNRFDIAKDEKDFSIFLKTLSELHSNYGVRVYAYCLMTNHFHLLLQTPLANLSRSMQHFGHCYTQRTNLIHRRDGHLFRGRYKAILVDGEKYLREVLRYIHLNPVKAGISEMPEHYHWSSYQHFFSQRNAPDFLDVHGALHLFAADVIDARKSLQEFTNEGNMLSFEYIYKRKRLPTILGEESVVRSLEHAMFSNRIKPN